MSEYLAMQQDLRQLTNIARAAEQVVDDALNVEDGMVEVRWAVFTELRDAVENWRRSQ